MRPKIFDTVEDEDIKTDWYTCGCIRSIVKFEKPKDIKWEIDERVNSKGKCSYHKKSI